MGYKLEMTGIEGLASALGLLALPFVILAVLIHIVSAECLDEVAAPTS